jgi:hypothetical protein
MVWSYEMDEKQVLYEGWVYPAGPLWDGEKLVDDKPIL